MVAWTLTNIGRDNLTAEFDRQNPSAQQWREVAAVTNEAFANCVYPARARRIDLSNNDSFNMALFNAKSNINPSSRLYRLITGEVAGDGYVAGGVPVSFVITGTADIFTVSLATNPIWTAVGQGFTTNYALIYHATTEETLCFCKFPCNVMISGGNTLTIDGGSFVIRLWC